MVVSGAIWVHPDPAESGSYSQQGWFAEVPPHTKTVLSGRSTTFTFVRGVIAVSPRAIGRLASLGQEGVLPVVAKIVVVRKLRAFGWHKVAQFVLSLVARFVRS